MGSVVVWGLGRVVWCLGKRPVLVIRQPLLDSAVRCMVRTVLISDALLVALHPTKIPG